MASEDLATATAPGQIDPTTLSPYDKMLLWVYGVRHNDFGGRNDVMPSIEVDRADATGPAYLARFLRWQLFGDVSARSEVLAAVDAEAPTSAFPPSVRPSSFEFFVELESETPEGLSSVVAYDPGPAIQQSARFIFGPAADACAAVQAMRTIRIPLTEFCGQGQLDLTRLVAVRLVFPDSQVEHHALIDSIEFTRDPNTVGTPTCPTLTAAWGCEVTAAFDSVETSCAGEPTPSCAPTDLRTVELSAPRARPSLEGRHPPCCP